MPVESPKIVPPPTEEMRRPMVGWYDPRPLFLTGFNVVVSTLFGRHSDYRLIEAIAAGNGDEIPDYTKTGEAPREEIWIDYVADAGDGWNSTYAVAYWSTRPRLEVATSFGARHETRTGDILIFGGDQVYPSASHRNYYERLVKPYETARNYSKDPAPHVFAIPGNHDWYDSLVSFTRLFCSGRWFQGWRTKQARSYFALKLPQRVWLIGADVQLGSDIDALQIRYFKDVAARMEPLDRIVICTAEPHWVFATAYQELDPEYNENNLRYFEKVLERNGASIVAYIAGDLHHYRRHANPEGAQKITAGGGGAFLHPTHAPDTSKLDNGFTLRSAYPAESVSRRLCWRNLLFPFINPKFGLAMGSLYGLLGHFWNHGQGLLLGPLVLVLGFVLFTDTHSAWYRRIAGTMHGLAHAGAAWALMRIVNHLVAALALPHRLLVEALTGTLTFAGGALIGSLLMGVYLLVSLNVFERHANEAFSSLRIEDFKNFLRLHIAPDGTLTIYPIGIERVPKRWKATGTTSPYEPQLEPDDAGATPPHLIEPPVVVRKPDPK
jgi:3',5'-cyclic AMP phosphodiesterase CpdA